ncbi:MAG: hypothetical protein ACTSPV_17815 [Candidatus Hodarchaeales archaeon]
MLWSRKGLPQLYLILGIMVIGFSFIIPDNQLEYVTSVSNSNDKCIAIFYGSQGDKRLGEELVRRINGNFSFYNITNVLSNATFVLDNESTSAVWWINELPLPINLGFIGDVTQWISTRKGLFIINRYFSHTPLEYLTQFGIRTYTPVLYPMNESFTEMELSLTNTSLSLVDINISSISPNVSTGWVELDNKTTKLASFKPPGGLLPYSNLSSGLWLVDSKVAIASFSLSSSYLNTPTRAFSLQNTNTESGVTIVDLLEKIGRLTLEDDVFPIASLEFQNIEPFLSTIAITLGLIISILAIFKLGLLSKVKEVVSSILTGLFLFLAHIAYSPQRRRINEDEILDNELRSMIMDYLEFKGGEGAHLREIQRELSCGISTLLWHLQALDDFNLVTHEKIGKYHIFYLTGEKSVQISEIALALKSDVAKELCRVLMRNKKPMPLSKISQEVDVHHSSVQHHIKKLLDLKLILVIKEKKRALYTINPSQRSWLKEHLEVA